MKTGKELTREEILEIEQIFMTLWDRHGESNVRTWYDVIVLFLLKKKLLNQDAGSSQ